MRRPVPVSAARPHRESAPLEVGARVLYEAAGVVVLDKPAGLPATGRELGDPRCAQTLVARHVGRPVWAVHQLDADTSGVLVFVARRSLVARWAERLRPPNAEKIYLAFCHGRADFERRDIEAPLAPNPPGTKPYFRVARDANEPGARQARTQVEVVDRAGEVSLLRATLLTGRPHQIRLHLAHVGLPLVGERAYRTPPCDAHPRHALHAWRIRFHDGLPPSEVTAPIPEDLRALAVRLGLRLPD